MLAPSMADQTMRSKFWSGLFRADIKNAIRHRKDSGESYSELLAAARAVESETQDFKPVKSHQATASADVPLDSSMAKTLDKILTMISGLDQRLSAKADDHTHRGGQRQDFQRPQPGASSYAPRSNFQPPSLHHAGPAQPASGGHQYSQGSMPRGYTPFKGSCHKCGQVGHMQRSCPLNCSQPSMGGYRPAAGGNAPIRQ